MIDNGFILLSRSLLESDVFASQKMLKIWIWCLLKANFKDRVVPLKVGKGDRIIKVKRGSFIFGRFKAEDELFIDGSTIYKLIKKLESLNMIKIESNNQYSIITICNYDIYQDSNNYQGTTKEQPSNNQVTTKEQPSNTTKNVNKDNKDKKDKNNKEEFQFNSFWDKFHFITNKPKTDKESSSKYWNKLSLIEKEKAINNIYLYYQSLDDKKYCKKARTYLSDKNFNDEFKVKQDKFTLKNYDIPNDDMFGIDYKELIEKCKQGHYKKIAS